MVAYPFSHCCHPRYFWSPSTNVAADGTASPASSSHVDAGNVYGTSFFILFGSVLFSIPHFLEYEIVFKDDGPSLAWTELRSDKLYTEIYTIGLDLALRVILPVIIILYTNIRYTLQCNH